MRYPLSTTLLSEAALPKYYTAALYDISSWCYLHLGLLQTRSISPSGTFTSRHALFIVGLLLFVLVTKWYRISCMLKTRRKKWSTSDSLPLRLFHFVLICYRPAGGPVDQVIDLQLTSWLVVCARFFSSTNMTIPFYRSNIMYPMCHHRFLSALEIRF